MHRLSTQTNAGQVYLSREIWVLHARALHLQGKMEADMIHTHTYMHTYMHRLSNQTNAEQVYLAREIWVLHARALHLQGKMEAARDILNSAKDNGMLSAEALADDTLPVHIPEVCMYACMYCGYVCSRGNSAKYTRIHTHIPTGHGCHCLHKATIVSCTYIHIYIHTYIQGMDAAVCIKRRLSAAQCEALRQEAHEEAKLLEALIQVCLYVCMYVCMHVCMCTYIHRRRTETN